MQAFEESEQEIEEEEEMLTAEGCRNLLKSIFE